MIPPMNQAQKTEGAGSRELISFLIGTQEFCVDIMSVREIRGWTPATPLPHSPPFVRGVINLRGAVLSIVDLAARLGFPPTEPSARAVIIVAQVGGHVGGHVVGLLVDAVTGILTVTADTVQPTPDVASDMARSFVTGVLAVEGRMISLITLDHVLPSVERQAA